MRNVAQRVDDEIVQIGEERSRGLRQRAEIREIRSAAKAKAEHFEIAMQQRHRNDLDAHQFERAVDNVEVHAGHGALRRRVIKNVRESAADDAYRFFRTVGGQRSFLANVVGTNVVEPKNVVGVAVGEQNGVEALEAGTQSLLPKIRRGVDDNIFSIA